MKDIFPIPDDTALRETVLTRQPIFDGHIMHVEQWSVRCPNGLTAGREIVLHKGAAAIVPVDDNGFVTLVRQHRVAIDECTWEIPAGKLDTAAEDPLECAKRELEEETGLRASDWKHLTRVITTPGFCSERISLFLATGLTQHTAHTDEDEFLRLCRVSLKDALDAVTNGILTDAKTALGLLLAAQALPQYL